MKKTLFLAPAGAFAIGAAALFLYRKNKAAKAAAEKPEGGRAASKAPDAAASYSFASGFKDARTVEAAFRYDGEKFSFATVSEDYLTSTGVSHAGILRGEDFAMQMEYASYYGGEDFEALAKHVGESFKGFGRVACGGLDGIRYYDGKSLCLAFPAGADYLLMTFVVPGDDADDEYLALWNNIDVQTLLASLSITVK